MLQHNKDTKILLVETLYERSRCSQPDTKVGALEFDCGFYRL